MSRDYYKIYSGPSMSPTFKTLDGLRIVPYGGRPIRPGDIIVFSPPGLSRKVTHRVISVDSEGIRTRGDNNPYDDPWVITPDQVLGRVACSQRRSWQLPIYGGVVGRLYAAAVRAIHLIDVNVSQIFHPAYHRLARTNIFRLVTVRFKTRILSFNRPTGTEMQLVIGHYVVGLRPPGQNKWQIRRPFRLLVDETALP
ncbi:MAG: S26 family signal peptidase [Deltaproteobacteria bacterium]|nr:MAG: S26 family signal peptidase [Deltaproteobacteria bacterium]